LAHPSSPHRQLLIKTTLLIIAVMLAPVLLVMIFGPQFEDWLTTQLLNNPQVQQHPVIVAVAMIIIMAADIVLPAPSSGAMTFAGANFGLLSGWLISFTGLSLSCFIGYRLGHHFGMPLLRRMASENDVRETAKLIDNHGTLALAGLRMLPAVGEVAVMVVSVYRMQPLKFWMAVTVGNSLLALAYCSLGHFAKDADWVLQALLISVLLPMILLLLWLIRQSSK